MLSCDLPTDCCVGYSVLQFKGDYVSGPFDTTWIQHRYSLDIT